MPPNIGMSDKIIRIIAGFTMIILGVVFDTLWGLLGVIPLITAAVNYCPLYSLFKLNTRRS